MSIHPKTGSDVERADAPGVTMQVVVKQFSGLGNQLFQYAAGRYYAGQLSAELRVASEQAHRAKSLGSFARPMLLSHFSVTAPMAQVTLADRLYLSHHPQVRRVTEIAGRLTGTEVFRESPAQEHRFLPRVPVRSGVKTLYLEGYWQAHAIADAIRPQLLREYALREPAVGKNLGVLQQIQTAACPVSLHVRRGDYALIGGGHMVLPADYYARAVRMLQQRLSHPEFFVFSDDMEHARACLPPGTRAVFVEGNDDFASHEDLRLMAACRHHVMANSSFSWWGAWLNPRADKVVIAPKHWAMTSDSYYPDRCPSDWILLETAR